MGFDDPDLRTPKHDAIVLWVAANANQLFVPPVPRFWFDRSGNRTCEIHAALEGMSEPYRQLFSDALVAQEADVRCAAKCKTKVEWEHQVFERWKTGRGRSVGFVDLRVVRTSAKIHVGFDVREWTDRGYFSVDDGSPYPQCPHQTLTAHEAETRRVKWESRDRREVVKCWISAEETKHEWWVEVKPRISSAGELFRQMNVYRSNAHNGQKLCVASPDARFKSLIEEQGYLFIEVPAEVANASRA
jgi:hypothetical protein